MSRLHRLNPFACARTIILTADGTPLSEILAKNTTSGGGGKTTIAVSQLETTTHLGASGAGLRVNAAQLEACNDDGVWRPIYQPPRAPTPIPIAILSGAITNATNASPIVITSVGHGLPTGAIVNVYNVKGNTAANGSPWTITALTADTFALNGTTGTGTYTADGRWQRLDAVQVLPRGQVLAADGTCAYALTSTEIVTFPTHGEYGTSEMANTLYYLVIGVNSSNATEIVLTTKTSGAVSQHASNTNLLHPAWLFYGIRNDENSHFLPFRLLGAAYYYDKMQSIFLGTAPTAYTSYDASGFVPPWASMRARISSNDLTVTTTASGFAIFADSDDGSGYLHIAGGTLTAYTGSAYVTRIEVTTTTITQGWWKLGAAYPSTYLRVLGYEL